MGLKPNQKMLSAAIDKDIYTQIESMSKEEFGSVNKFCNWIFKTITENPEIIPEIKFKIAQKNLSDNYKQYTKFHPHGDEQVDRIIEELRTNFNSVNNSEP